MTKAVFGILCITISLIKQADAQSFLTNGLVAYYPFNNGSLADLSGQGHVLSNFGATVCPDRFGDAEQALNFNGSAYLAATNSPLSTIDNWTLTAWVQPTNFNPGEEYVMCMGFDNGNSGNGYAFGVEGGQLAGWFGGVNGFYANYTFPATNQWHQVVMSRDSGTTAFYVDGVSTGTTSTLVPLAPTAFSIGSASSIRFFTGAIDDVRVYNRPLSVSEIRELYQYESLPNLSYQATGVAQLTSTFVTAVVVTYGGFGYTNVPDVTLSGGGGSGAEAVAVVNDGIVTAVNVVDAGHSYTNPPQVVIAAPLYPYPASAIAVLTNGFVTGVAIVFGGNRYTNPPAVKIVGGGGSGAEAVAVVSNGVVTAIDMLDAGSGYTNTPMIFIDPPFIPNPILSVARIPTLTFSNLVVGDNYQLQELTEGYYWTNQPLNFTATASVFTLPIPGSVTAGNYRLTLNPVPAQAFAEPDVVYSFLVDATVTSGGSGYVTNPAVNIVGGNGEGATAIAHVSGGAVTNITITDAGIGYTNTVQIEIAPPPATSFSPTVQEVMQINSTDLAPYDNYQVQSAPSLGGPWSNWSGGPFIPTYVTNAQYLAVPNDTMFFRVQYLHP
ncbi:MAG TPA: LamG domain-containing protein [Verrucomicrobiae bacterium]|jgi:hypothetical protein|nr:LamG domain-containing protein [Verrucomicrobiae bacterium]